MVGIDNNYIPHDHHNIFGGSLRIKVWVGEIKRRGHRGGPAFWESFKCGQNMKWNCMHLSVRRIFQFTSDVLQAMGELNHVLLLVFLKDLQLDIQSIIFYSTQALHWVKGKGKSGRKEQIKCVTTLKPLYSLIFIKKYRCTY